MFFGIRIRNTELLVYIAGTGVKTGSLSELMNSNKDIKFMWVGQTTAFELLQPNGFHRVKLTVRGDHD